MHIKKTHSQNGKKYNVIIRAEENIVEDKGYLTFFKEVKMSNKAPVWFTNWTTKFEKEVISRLDNLEKDMKQVKQDIVLIKNCPTIKRELK